MNERSGLSDWIAAATGDGAACASGAGADFGFWAAASPWSAFSISACSSGESAGVSGCFSSWASACEPNISTNAASCARTTDLMRETSEAASRSGWRRRPPPRSGGPLIVSPPHGSRIFPHVPPDLHRRRRRAPGDRLRGLAGPPGHRPPARHRRPRAPARRPRPGARDRADAGCEHRDRRGDGAPGADPAEARAEAAPAARRRPTCPGPGVPPPRGGRREGDLDRGGPDRRDERQVRDRGELRRSRLRAGADPHPEAGDLAAAALADDRAARGRVRRADPRRRRRAPRLRLWLVQPERGARGRRATGAADSPGRRWSCSIARAG